VLAALGLLTYVRLVEIGIENMGHLAAIQRIRRFYAGLSPRGTSFFPDLAESPDRYGDNEVDSLRFMELTGGRWQMWFTAASVVGIINSMLVGAGVALALGALAHRPALAAAVGAAVAVALVLLHPQHCGVDLALAWESAHDIDRSHPGPAAATRPRPGPDRHRGCHHCGHPTDR
jgi:hypothetical protein